MLKAIQVPSNHAAQHANFCLNTAKLKKKNYSFGSYNLEYESPDCNDNVMKFRVKLGPSKVP